MILDRLPDLPGRKVLGTDGQPLKYIGYWHARFREPTTGMVSEGHEFHRYEALLGPEVLPSPWDYVDIAWDADERHVAFLYLRNAKEYESWKGRSACRFGCKGVDLGFRDFTDGVFVWPEGFAHYIDVHNVKPPEEFLRHMRARWKLMEPTR